jgi:hypothetical protein
MKYDWVIDLISKPLRFFIALAEYYMYFVR